MLSRSRNSYNDFTFICCAWYERASACHCHFMVAIKIRIKYSWCVRSFVLIGNAFMVDNWWKKIIKLLARTL